MLERVFTLTSLTLANAICCLTDFIRTTGVFVLDYFRYLTLTFFTSYTFIA